MKRRTLAQWQKLTPAYRQRLEKRGISESLYRTGTPLAAARGHAVTPEHPGRTPSYVTRAISNGIIGRLYIPGLVWQQMTPAQRAKAARDYQLAYFEKGQGERLTKAQREKRGLLPTDRNVYRHRSKAQETADVEFQQLMVEIHGHTWGKEEWVEFRSIYYNTFSNAA